MSLIPTRFRPAEFHRSVWSATVEHGTDARKVFDPKFWAHLASTLKVGDRIEIETDSREWFAEVYVVEVGTAFARVRPLRFVDLAEEAPAGAGVPGDVDFEVKWMGPARKWGVVRLSDKAAIYSDLPSKDAAQAKLAQHVRPVAA